MKIFNCTCDQYAGIARLCYSQYVLKNNQLNNHSGVIDLSSGTQRDYDFMALSIEVENCAVVATVFQALAIEAYVNLFGTCELGEKYYTEIEPPKDEKPKGFRYLSTTDKLIMICDLLPDYSSYPIRHAEQIRKLFEKRNKLVHLKPQLYDAHIESFDYSNPEKSYAPYVAAYQEIAFVFEDIEKDMRLYDEMRANIKIISRDGSDFIVNSFGEMYKEMIEAVADVYKDEGKT